MVPIRIISDSSSSSSSSGSDSSSSSGEEDSSGDESDDGGNKAKTKKLTNGSAAAEEKVAAKKKEMTANRPGKINYSVHFRHVVRSTLGTWPWAVDLGLENSLVVLDNEAFLHDDPTPFIIYLWWMFCVFCFGPILHD